MSKKISRRTFLKTSGALGATAGLTTILPDKAKAARFGEFKKIERIPTICEQCFWRCGIIATVIDGKLHHIEGNPKNPNNRGKICARGNAGVALLYEKDRLKNPMIRVGERGSGEWRNVSWEDALDFTAENLLKVSKKYGVQANALFSHGASAKFFRDLYKYWGTPNMVAPSFAQCLGPRNVAYELTYGETIGSPERLDLANSKVIVLIGSALGENIHTGQIIDFTDAIGKGTQIISVDPRFSVAASKAKWWLPIKPGTDTALLLSWIHVVINEKGYDADFVRRSTEGFGKLKKHVAKCTPEWAAKITEIPAHVIIETARAMMKAKPAVLIHPGRHSAWYGNDVQRARALAILSALLGSWGQKGGYFLKTQLPLHYDALPIPDAPQPQAERADGAGTIFPLGGNEGLTQEMVKATLNQKPYPIKSWMVFGQNIFNSIPSQEDTLRAIDNLDFYAVVDLRPTQPTWYADVILPEDTYLERYDKLMTVTSWREPYIALRQPVVKRQFNTRPGWWIARELGERLGLGAYYPYKDYEDVIRHQLKSVDINFEQLKREGVMTFPGRPYLKKGQSYSFKTESGKVQLFSKELEELGFDPMPKFEPVDDPPKGYFRLVYGLMPVHSHGKTESNPWLNTIISEAHLWINETIGRSMGLKDGQEVTVENQDGFKSDKIKVLMTPGMRPDAVYLPHGFGGNDRGLLDFTRRQISDNHLISHYTVDPICGSTGLRVNFVRLMAEGQPLIPTAEVSFTGIVSQKMAAAQPKEIKVHKVRKIKQKKEEVDEGC